MKTQLQKIGLQGVIVACTISLSTCQFFMGGDNSYRAEANPTIAQISSVNFTPPPPPPDRDAPGNRGGGAGRGCSVGSQAVIALVPEYEQTLEQGTITKVWGTTTAERPTFWFDVPYQRGTIAAMELVLQDNSTPAKTLYRSEIVPPEAPGIISIQVPATVPSLEVGKLYRWFFKVRLQCGSNPSAGKPQIQKEELYGWVQRVSPSPALISQLKQATPQQRAALYAQNGIWFDALTTLAELHLAKPQEAQLTQDWKRLLQAIDLETLAAKPLIQCCQPKS